jgi:undecaprenyl-diphosphatase
MTFRNLRFSDYEKRLSLWFGASFLFLAIFLKMTSELVENEVQGRDALILAAIASVRRPWLTGIAIDLTALGSMTLVTLISLIALCVLLLLRDRLAASQLLLNSAGAALLTMLTKNLIERTRPENVEHLVHVTGFSYPSGHSLVAASLYLTIAILTAHHLPTLQGRVLLFCIALAVVFLVGMSRMYLGVHYPSDVASGVSLGAAWALLLAAGFSTSTRRRAHQAPA